VLLLQQNGMECVWEVMQIHCTFSMVGVAAAERYGMCLGGHAKLLIGVAAAERYGMCLGCHAKLLHILHGRCGYGCSRAVWS